MILPEGTWGLKRRDKIGNSVDVSAIDSGWKGKFDELSDMCEASCQPRTDRMPTTYL